MLQFDIQKIVQDLRRQRQGMIQTKVGLECVRLRNDASLSCHVADTSTHKHCGSLYSVS